jgi:hypothetical protein
MSSLGAGSLNDEKDEKDQVPDLPSRKELLLIKEEDSMPTTGLSTQDVFFRSKQQKSQQNDLKQVQENSYQTLPS